MSATLHRTCCRRGERGDNWQDWRGVEESWRGDDRANAVAVESCARPLQLTAEGAAAEEPRAEAAAAAADDGEEDIIIATS
jgi:hypothetical protein